MLEQLAIDFSPREVGRAAADACADKAERTTTFVTANAKVFVLGYLAKHGNSSGEDIVDAAEGSSRPDLTPHDSRSWGSVFASLVRGNQIRCVGYCERRKGHATAGGRVWALVL